MKQAYVLEKEELDFLIKEIRATVSAELRDEMEKVRSLFVEKPIDINQAADFLKINRVTLHRRIKNGTMPANIIHRVDGSVYFFPSELHQHIKKS